MCINFFEIDPTLNEAEEKEEEENEVEFRVEEHVA